MSTTQSIERQGTVLLREQLIRAGRDVRDSDNKTFDLIVDGRYAEVKCKGAPYARMDFIGLTENQHRALEEGRDFLLFLVCNVNSPESVEVIELEARHLLREEPKVERTFYWYKSALDRLRGG